MLDFEACLSHVSQPFPGLIDPIRRSLADVQFHGRAAEWDQVLDTLPRVKSSRIDFRSETVSIGAEGEIPDPTPLLAGLKALHPWRKGPWSYFGTTIDSEWRSNLKWRRLKPHLSNLAGRNILDVGSGNGYYLLRMLGEGASLALGIDPTTLFLYQFEVAKRFCETEPNAYVLPLKSEQFPSCSVFDTVFSLGVLYHRRTPLDHLAELASFLTPGGELVLETLVIDGDASAVLTPKDRYAMMNNVFYLPSTLMLEDWLKKSGFSDIRTIDITRTSIEEQRATEWMTFQSLGDFLDPTDHTKTIEGYPAPTRAIVIAKK